MSYPVDSGLVTGEAVALDLRTAALPSRAVAFGVDALVQVLLLIALAMLATATSFSLSEAAGAVVALVVLVLVTAVYPVAFETLLRGRTPGKAAMGLRVVRDDGGPIGFRQALVRGLSGAFLEKPGITAFVLPVVCSLLNARGKRMGDLLAGTVVVQERVGTHGGAVAVMPPPLEAWARTLELSRLPDTLALSVRSFVSRSGELTPAAREDLGGRLVHAVLQVTAPPPPPGTPGWAFLAAVLAERRRRETERLAGWAGGGQAGPGGGQAGPGLPGAPAAGPAPAWSGGAPAGPPPAAAPPAAAPPAAAPSAAPERPGGFALPS